MLENLCFPVLLTQIYNYFYLLQIILYYFLIVFNRKTTFYTYNITNICYFTLFLDVFG